MNADCQQTTSSPNTRRIMRALEKTIAGIILLAVVLSFLSHARGNAHVEGEAQNGVRRAASQLERKGQSISLPASAAHARDARGPIDALLNAAHEVALPPRCLSTRSAAFVRTTTMGVWTSGRAFEQPDYEQ